MIRLPAVAGQFYPAEQQELIALVDRLLDDVQSNIKAFGVIVPHAGYEFSGRVAGSVFAKILIPDEVILLGPKHSGQGPLVSIMSTGTWTTPLGEVSIAEELAESLVREVPVPVHEDAHAHQLEHSIEVELPFLQRRRPSVRIVPIAVTAGHDTECVAFGTWLGQWISRYTTPPLLVASSDFSHYEPLDVAQQHDKMALSAIRQLDAVGLLHLVHSTPLSMCGAAPVAALLSAARQADVRQVDVVHHTSSADTTHDESSVVGYAGVILS